MMDRFPKLTVPLPGEASPRMSILARLSDVRHSDGGGTLLKVLEDDLRNTLCMMVETRDHQDRHQYAGAAMKLAGIIDLLTNSGTAADNLRHQLSTQEGPSE